MYVCVLDTRTTPYRMKNVRLVRVCVAVESQWLSFSITMCRHEPSRENIGRNLCFRSN